MCLMYEIMANIRRYSGDAETKQSGFLRNFTAVGSARGNRNARH
jgi:hypothetical protein